QLNQAAIGFDVTGPHTSTHVEDKIRNGLIGSILNSHTVPVVRTLQKMAVEETRLHIPLLFGYDVIHGHSTIFPIPLGISASWDLDAIETSASIAAAEASSQGLNWTFSPMVDIARDPRWGRVAEGAGEDSYYGSLVAAAMVRGYQGSDLSATNTILACVKHFGLYGAAIAGRDYNTVDMSLVQMYEDYLPPYQAAVEAGVGSAMTSFNDINGVPATGNKWLLTSLLRDDWKFDGFVVTDYNAIAEMIAHGYSPDGYYAAKSALDAGVDMDMVDECFLHNLEKLVTDGKISESQIDTACRRILEAKYKLGLFADPYHYLDQDRADSEILKKENRDFARELAQKSCVLLKNQNSVLPLTNGAKIALVGPLANTRFDLLGCWWAAGSEDSVVSVYDGLKNAVGSENIILARGADVSDDKFLIDRMGGGIARDGRPAEEMLNEAIAAAQQSDIIVAVVGEHSSMSGEAKSRTDISIPESQQRLMRALKQTGKPLVLVLMNGRPLALEWEYANADAILETWFAGVEGGNAIADVLCGKYNPSGKLTMSFPLNAGQIPVYYNIKSTGRPFNPGDNALYRSAYIDAANEPLLPFGFGLSYTSFEYSNITLDKNTLTSDGKITATVTITNTGDKTGIETVQLYTRDMFASITPPLKRLRSFERVTLAAGESKAVTFEITEPMLRFYNSKLEHLSEPGEFRLYIGTNSRDCKEASFQLK
ncbi:MAG: beta-glucosidase BglX, partial [Sedimentisphaerales bacterium]|nr:beta-glucosidase BglX [Sedimentisphaerales bacterium]